MTRDELARDLDVVARHLVLLAAVTENLLYSLRTPQDGPEEENDAPVVPAVVGASTGMGNAAAGRRPRTTGNLPATHEKRLDGTGMPSCTCPPCLAERARGERP